MNLLKENRSHIKCLLSFLEVLEGEVNIFSEIYYPTTHLVFYVVTEISLLFLESKNNPLLKNIILLWKLNLIIILKKFLDVFILELL